MNGTVVVESEAELTRRREQRKKNRCLLYSAPLRYAVMCRSSRWDAAKTPAASGTSSATAVVELGYQHTNTPLLQQPRQFQAGVSRSLPSSINLSRSLKVIRFKYLKLSVQAPTNINLSNLENKEQQLYLAQMGIRDCTNRLNLPNLGIPVNPKDRWVELTGLLHPIDWEKE